MRLLALLYGRFDRSYSPNRFNRFYRLDGDPFGAKNSKYELSKQDRLLEMIARRDKWSALDIGCGNGFLSRRIASHCQHLHGIDFSSQAVRLARENCKDHSNISFSVEDIRTLEASNQYNLLICSEVLYYLQGSELDDTVKKLYSLSAPDAWLGLVGRAEAQKVPASLDKWFECVERVEDQEWYRPYAVSIYTPRQADKVDPSDL
jgi:2-polyprenyl-3-methyl-5-hydroxy-6-metoxy-1,4-benzoquinol methylase